MAIRDKNDQEWKRVKDIVWKRDKSRCRLCEILTISEKYIFDGTNPTQKNLDCAHVFPVSTHPSHVYNTRNIYLLCRSHHHMIDDYLSPITGKQISKNRHFWWWFRAIKATVEPYDKERDYETEVEKLTVGE